MNPTINVANALSHTIGAITDWDQPSCTGSLEIVSFLGRHSWLRKFEQIMTLAV